MTMAKVLKEQSFFFDLKLESKAYEFQFADELVYDYFMQYLGNNDIAVKAVEEFFISCIYYAKIKSVTRSKEFIKFLNLEFPG